MGGGGGTCEELLLEPLKHIKKENKEVNENDSQYRSGEGGKKELLYLNKYFKDIKYYNKNGSVYIILENRRKLVIIKKIRR